jgi:hypothetical protein
MSELNNPFDRFPEMRPVRTTPPLTRVNGIGTTLIGDRDHDAETQTYVKTLAFTVLYLPLLAVGAYRVADAPDGGWYFLGKVPLSGFAKACNLLLLLAVLAVAGLIGWNAYTDSPDYKAGRKLAEADRLLADGMAAEAAAGYRDVLLGNTSRADEARDRLKGLIESPPASLEQAAAVFKIAAELHQVNRPVTADLYQRGAKQAEEHADASPAGALALLDSVAPLAPRPADVLPLRRRLLEALLAQDPQNPEVASRLAVVCGEQGDVARCEAVLSPVAGRLGALEGAALLGRIYSDQRQYDKAVALLEPYLDAHLPKLHAADKKLKDAAGAVSQRALQQLKNETVADFDYRRYDAADMHEKQEMVKAYVIRKVQEDPVAAAAERELDAERAAGQAALDLGLALLHRAQTRADPAARKKDLEKAEKTFLVIRGLRGEDDQSRLYLGQVYYWLGKPADGRKLFDEVLKANNRDTNTLYLVGRALREVGDVSAARDLIEEAYNHEGNTAPRQAMALVRAIIPRDLDDQIAWLAKADPKAAEVRALLSRARGNKAEQEGKDAEAVAHYREAVAAHDAMPVSYATLNNGALAHLALYRLTHEPEQLRQAMTKLERAVALQPDDALILHNAADVLLDNALHDLIGPELDLKVLKRGADLDLLAFLCRDRDAKARYVARLRRHPGWLKARTYFEKLLVLSPKQSYAYGRLVQVYGWMRDVDGLRDVWRRLQGVELDLADQNRDLFEGYTGKNDKKKQEDLKNALARNQAILAAARKAGGATFAAAAASHIYSVIHRASAAPRSEVPVPDADALVRLAEEAHAAAPSQATTGLLSAVLGYRAHKALAGQDAVYGAQAKRTQRSLAYALLTYVLAREGPLRDKVLANADLRRAVALDREQVEAFPDDVSPAMWAWLLPTHPEEAARVAKLLQEDPLEKLQRSFEQALSPLGAGTLLNQYLMLRLAGKNSEAAAVFQGAAAKGVPLPES